MNLIQLDPVRLTWALGLMAVAIALSAWERLGLEWRLAITTVRTIVQLVGVAIVLEVIFAWKNPWAVLAILAVMSSIAAIVARNRISQKISRLLPIVWGSLLVSTALVLTYINLLVLQPQNWYEPQYLIPLAGIVLGNAMNAAALAGERLNSSLNAGRLDIETHLSLGATPQQAVVQYRQEAIASGMIPTLNSMAIVGIVTLPGILTGQLLSGVNPLMAAFYQMLILFMLACATLIVTVLVTRGICHSVFNSAAQLRL